MFICIGTPIMFISLYNIYVYIYYIFFLNNGIEKLYFTIKRNIFFLYYINQLCPSIDFIIFKTNELCLTFQLQHNFISPNWQLPLKH